MDSTNSMTRQEMLRAVWSNDASYDGRFFFCVKTTGVYCHPSCPSRVPKADSVSFAGSRAEAEALGYRPCRRCHSDLDGGVAEYEQKVIERALAVVDSDPAGATAALVAARLGYSVSHLARLFRRRVGCSLAEHIRRRRIELAATLLRGTTQPVLDIAVTVGYESPSALYEAFSKRFGVAPGKYRLDAQRGGERL